MMRVLLIALLFLAPFEGARARGESLPDRAYGHAFTDLLEAVRTLRKKTNPMAYFWLELPQYPEAPIFTPEGNGEAYFVLLIAKTYSESETPPPDEIAAELARLKQDARFAATYDARRRRLVYYPPEAVTESRRCLFPWLHPTHPLWSRLPGLEMIVARIPRDHEAEFLDALLSGFLRTSREDLKCSIARN